MKSSAVSSSLRCSARLVRPFLEVLYDESEQDERLRALGLSSFDDELTLPRAYELLDAVIAHTADESLGLRAGARMRYGDAGVLDYLMGTANTVREAFESAGRFFSLRSEALRGRLIRGQRRAQFMIEFRIKQPPAAEDFMLSSVFAAQAWIRAIPGLECCFQHALPADELPYVSMFTAAACRFSSSYSGFSFPLTQLDARLASADVRLHAVVRELAEIRLARRARNTSYADQVRAVMMRELSARAPNSAFVANHLRMSVRTLARRLESEGTSFSVLLDDVRRRRALALLVDPSQTLERISQATGFSHVVAFLRAFKRWTGTTPTAYRTRG